MLTSRLKRLCKHGLACLQPIFTLMHQHKSFKCWTPPWVVDSAYFCWWDLLAGLQGKIRNKDDQELDTKVCCFHEGIAVRVVSGQKRAPQTLIWVETSIQNLRLWDYMHLRHLVTMSPPHSPCSQEQKVRAEARSHWRILTHDMRVW